MEVTIHHEYHAPEARLRKKADEEARAREIQRKIGEQQQRARVEAKEEELRLIGQKVQGDIVCSPLHWRRVARDSASSRPFAEGVEKMKWLVDDLLRNMSEGSKHSMVQTLEAI